VNRRWSRHPAAAAAAAHAEAEEQLARAQRVADMSRFTCPSYYIPGKQAWGAL
jgi:hypothetical protein